VQETRGGPRRKVVGQAEVLSEDEVLLVASIFDLSEKGMTIRTPPEFQLS
jgi:hypothetical protein